ncbi:MAG: DNA gyrase inhibitor YacG [Bryobacteraceae bacterium]
MSARVECPTCKKPVELGAEYFPFCGERCQLIDLGRWADGEYRVPVVDETPGTEEERGGAGEDAGPCGGELE